ncbi:hypothetical protein IWZ00DRAFT_570741 [Phyllosticta capitalensis]|uniref:uncharacterized protein n=1 Tax=Phyllosticta capitalensis TaxID=121624 RepID=UPI0031326CAA
MSSVPPASDNTSPSIPVRSNTNPRDLQHVSPPPSPSPPPRDPDAVVIPKKLSQTGRSRTAPLSLEALYPSAGPQLSERDSIFATNYVTTDSPADSPNLQPRFDPDSPQDPPQSQPSSQDMAQVSPIRKLVDPPLLRQSHHLYTPSRATPTTPPDCAAFADELHKFNHNAQSPQPESQRRQSKEALISKFLDARFAPVPQQDHSTTTDTVDSLKRTRTTSREHHAEQEPWENDERVRYRSWREGKPALSMSAHQSVKDTNGTRVDKKIEATLPKAEPAAAARSRKASHYLGLFKENEAAQEQKKREKDRTAADAANEGRDPSAPHDGLPPTPKAEKGLDSAVLLPVRESRPEPQASPRKSPLPQTPRKTPKDIPEEDFDADSIVSIRPDQHPIPINLLEEIRNFHNLTPGSKRGSSFSRSLAATESERAKDSPVKPIADASGQEPCDYFGDARSSEEEKANATDEDDESEKEHISSALYIPHRQLTPTKGTPDALSPAREETNLEEPASRGPSRLDREETPTPDEVQISLQTQDDEQYLHGDLKRPPQPAEADKVETLVSESEQSVSFSESECESGYESVRSTYGNESATEELGTTPTQDSYKQSGTSTPKPHHHHHRRRPTAPLGAVELKPYDHQVGGHSTVYRFSRRAVCKQLNNRENEFYETVERNHPELLDFLPRYIGVLNVTYRKAPKKKKAIKDSSKEQEPEKHHNKAYEAVQSELESPVKSNGVSDHQPRVVSHSQQILPVPQVIFENNRHIIPENLFHLPPRPSAPRPHTGDASLLSQQHRRQLSMEASQRSGKSSSGTSPSRPELRHNISWGATTVNNRLREQVLKEVFTPPTIHHHFRHDRNHHSLPGSKRGLNPADLNGGSPLDRRGSADVMSRRSHDEENPRKQALLAETERHFPDQYDGEGRESRSLERFPSLPQLKGLDSVKDVEEKAMTSIQQRPRRRHSGGGLRRRIHEIDSNTQGDLEYHEEDGYGGDREEDVFTMDEEKMTPNGPNGALTPSKNGVQDSSSLDMLPAPVAIPRILPPESPQNPKQSMQSDERVQHFILLEDLTAGMSRPCVLDLKMGTRQYGIEATEKKQRSQRRKCQMTTSRQLGVRVCGMQVWNAKTQSYIFEDKYFGRDLKAGKEFQDALTRFFFDGHGYTSATKHIPVILDKIAQLERMIRGLPGYRFYASSLLMLYDHADVTDVAPKESANGHAADGQNGQKTAEGAKKSHKSGIKLKIVDFANCVTAEDKLPEDVPCPPSNPAGVDRGYLRGLRTLRMYFQRIWRDMNQGKEYVERGECEGLSLGEGDLGHGMTAGGWDDGLVMDDDSGNVSV